MNRSTDRILTTHVGSLVRPISVLQGMRARTLGAPLDEAVFEEEIAKAVHEVVKKQISVGIDIPSDGEFGRQGFMSYINQRLDGLATRELDPGEDVWSGRREQKLFPGFFEHYDRHYRRLWMPPEVSLDELSNVPGTYERFRVTGPIAYKGHRAINRELEVLKSALANETVADAFMPATQPASRRSDRNVLDHYPSVEAYLYALADAFHEEYKAIADAGFIIQIDYPNMQTPSWLLSTRPQAEETEVKRAAELGIEALNYALRDIPEESVRFHYCWGSMNEPHTSDPPLTEIVGLVLKVKAQAYSIEAANPRHEHEWMVWKDRKLPDGKILIPGLISHQTNVVEHPELVAWRIKNFASVVGKENVIAGADCGFSQFWDSIRVHPSVQWAKLESLVQGAALASKALWS